MAKRRSKRRAQTRKPIVYKDAEDFELPAFTRGKNLYVNPVQYPELVKWLDRSGAQRK